TVYILMDVIVSSVNVFKEFLELRIGGEQVSGRKDKVVGCHSYVSGRIGNGGDIWKPGARPDPALVERPTWAALEHPNRPRPFRPPQKLVTSKVGVIVGWIGFTIVELGVSLILYNSFEVRERWTGFSTPIGIGGHGIGGAAFRCRRPDWHSGVNDVGATASVV